MLDVIYVASKLGKPVLAEGPTGSGKTELAQVVAIAAATHIERIPKRPTRTSAAGQEESRPTILPWKNRPDLSSV
jgi:Rad3-related DNA helicase